MQLSNIQVAGLRAEAACQTSEVARTLEGAGRLAYLRGIQDGRTQLARELLQEVADRTAQLPANGSQPSCVNVAFPGSCRCKNCDPYKPVDR